MVVPGSEVQISDDQLTTWLSLVQVVDTIRDRLEEQLLSEAQLTLPQLGVLAHLRQAPGGTLRMTDLADELVASRSGTTYQVRRLVALGLVERRPSATDERSVDVSINDSGREHLQRLRPGHDLLLHQMLFSKIDEGAPEDFAALVRELRQHMSLAPPRSVRRRSHPGTH